MVAAAGFSLKHDTGSDRMIRAVLAEVGLHGTDYRAEVARLFDSAGLRMRYVRKSGVSIDAFAELIWSRGITLRRLDCTETLDLLEMVFSPAPKPSKRVKATSKGIDTAETRARKMRLRKLVCDGCGQIARGTRKSELICGVCHAAVIHDVARFLGSLGDNPTAAILAGLLSGVSGMRRVDPLPEEILEQAAGIEVAA